MSSKQKWACGVVAVCLAGIALALWTNPRVANADLTRKTSDGVDARGQSTSATKTSDIADANPRERSTSDASRDSASRVPAQGAPSLTEQERVALEESVRKSIAGNLTRIATAKKNGTSITDILGMEYSNAREELALRKIQQRQFALAPSSILMKSRTPDEPDSLAYPTVHRDPQFGRAYARIELTKADESALRGHLEAFVSSKITKLRGLVDAHNSLTYTERRDRVLASRAAKQRLRELMAMGDPEIKKAFGTLPKFNAAVSAAVKKRVPLLFIIDEGTYLVHLRRDIRRFLIITGGG